ncbi:MAG: hypothetical protein ABR499_19805 [Gemmatimonadaceae bacterium]
MRKLFGTAAALLLFASSASAQARQGFTVSFGLGAGSAGFSYEGSTSEERATGPSGYLRVGGAVTPSLIIAGESHGWTRSEGSVTSRVGYLMAVAQWYPQATGGFHLLGGLGLGMISENDTDPGFAYELESVGAAVQFGLGYDVRMSRNFSLSPYVNFLGMGGGEPKLDGTGLGGTLSANVVQFGLGFSWH